MSLPTVKSRTPRRANRRRATGAAAAAALVAATAACGGSPAQGPGRDVVRSLSVARFATAADNETQYLKIWKKPPTQTQLNQNRKFLQNLNDDVVRVLPEANVSAAQSWLDSYRTSVDDVVTLIGHNDGTAFRFSDGSYVELSVLEQVNGPPLAFLSCDSYTAGGQIAGVPGKLTLAMAASMEQRIVAAVADLDEAPTREHLRDLIVPIYNDEVKQVRVDRGVKVVGGVSLVGGGGLVTVRLSEQY